MATDGFYDGPTCTVPEGLKCTMTSSGGVEKGHLRFAATTVIKLGMETLPVLCCFAFLNEGKGQKTHNSRQVCKHWSQLLQIPFPIIQLQRIQSNFL